MAVDAILVYGTRLFYSTDGGTNYTELADMRVIGAPGTPTSPEVDITPLYDTDDFRQFRLGLATAGEMSGEQFFNKTRMAFWDTNYRKKFKFKIVFPDGANLAASSKTEFDAWVKEYTSPEANNPDDPAVIKFKLKLTGKPTFTAGS